MNFFDHQERARRNTGWLILYFMIAVVMVIAAVYLVMLSVAVYVTRTSEHPVRFFEWNPGLLTAVVTVVTSMIGVGSLYKIWTLGSHGEQVAVSLGGVKIPPNTRKLEERILLNVVEEMALASGTPVPPVYLMEEEMGINAFAAGTSPQNAVIGITRGAILTLNRDELQGVIAHEFSHILNGDMRLNLRLIGLLNGILVIALTGYVLLRLLGQIGFRSSSNSNDNKGAGAVIALVAAVGAALVAIGYVGVFFANLIKSAVSRQREFLADASAVQFTRNPTGITDALKKIGGWKQHSKIQNVRATEASHMFFGEGVVSRLFATHPALITRIQRIDPRFDGKFDETDFAKHTASEVIDPRSLSMTRASFANAHAAAVAGADFHERVPNNAVERIGEPGPEHLEHAHHLVDELGQVLTQDVRDPLGAIAVVYSLLLAPETDSIRERQLRIIGDTRDLRVQFEMDRVMPRVDSLEPEKRLPLACLALPALHQMSPSQINQFRNTVRQLIDADRKWTVFEYAIQRFVSKRLVRRLEQGQSAKSSAKSTLVQPSFQLVLSLLANLGAEASIVQKAFDEGKRAAGASAQGLTLIAKEQCTLKSLDNALDALETAMPLQKQTMLQAFSACIASDGKVDLQELELLRVISDSLGCPMPPILQEQAV